MSIPTYQNPPSDLPAMASWPATRHVFEADHILALRAAEAAGRPLLVRGDPGTGKSQLAHAAAVATGRLFIPFVIDSRTEASDLMWRFDAVARLSDAQLAGGPRGRGQRGLAPSAYLQPGPLWWAYDFQGAMRHQERARVRSPVPDGVPPGSHWSPQDGTVLLVDEIDKAEAEVPNGLLEVLGNGRFTVPMTGQVVARAPDCPPPLVIVTTNDERELPAPFLRRCLVLSMKLPREDDLPAYLTARGQLHFPNLADRCPDVLDEAANMLLDDRRLAESRGAYKPGLAEYLDLLRVLDGLPDYPLDRLGQLRTFTFHKQPD